MTSKERMLTAFRNEQPDRIPASPDFSNMIPVKLTGKPFWDIYLYSDPPRWKAYIEAVRRYKIDGIQHSGYLGPTTEETSAFEPKKLSSSDEREFKTRIVSQTETAITARTYCTTPKGVLWRETVYPRSNPPWIRRGYVKNLEEDLELLNYFYPDPSTLSPAPLREMTEAMGDQGITGLHIPVPGLHNIINLLDGGFEAAVKAYYLQHDLLKELCRMQEEWNLAYLERGLEFQPEFIAIGASGLMTLQSPKILQDLSLSTLKKATRMAEKADIPSHLHCCGLERYLVEVCAKETDLDSIEPLEKPPMGDCDLAEIKKRFGDRLALKGNLPTTEVMLLGTLEKVEKEAKACIDAAGEGGGFVLSTGDQCGRDTPEENIYKLVEVAKTYGRY